MSHQFDQLINRYLTGSMEDTERADFLDRLEGGVYDHELDMSLDRALREKTFENEQQAYLKEIIYEKLRHSLTLDGEEANVKNGPASPRRYFIRVAGYAAAVLLVVFSAVYFFRRSSEEDMVSASQEKIIVPLGIAPGSNRAVLTLADGSVVDLDGIANGTITRQGNTIIEKLSDGRVVYHHSGSGNEAVFYNTMSTPRGGQYQLRLPDGSMVWLNAASSITYPTAFTGNERRVKISGEAYFEVAPLMNRGKKDKVPFFVDFETPSEGFGEIEVLGTHFNVNAYPDETTAKTTLLEGSVKINSSILKPGEQFAGGEISAVNPNQSIAWKNGYFNFNNTSLDGVMKQLSRWYNIEVVYEEGIPETTFGGEMQRSLPLSDVLEFLKGSQVHFKVVGKKLIVMP